MHWVSGDWGYGGGEKLVDVRTLAWPSGRLLALGALLLFGLGACVPSPNKVIRDQQNAGVPPGDLSTFFSSEKQRGTSILNDDYLTVTVCGKTRESCNPYESDYLPGFFEALGPLRYSEPVKITMRMSANVTVTGRGSVNSRGSGLVQRWFSCFMPLGSDRLYYFYSEDGKHSTVHSGVSTGAKGYTGGTLFYRDPGDSNYEAALERCGPMEQTTRILLAKE